MKNGDERDKIAQAHEWVQNFCSERDWDQFHGPKDLAIGLVTEASELLELFRFKSESQTEADFKSPQFIEKASDELADIFFFLLRFSQRQNIDLMKALKAKIEKTAKKYPIETSRGKNVKYTEL